MATAAGAVGAIFVRVLKVPPCVCTGGVACSEWAQQIIDVSEVSRMLLPFTPQDRKNYEILIPLWERQQQALDLVNNGFDAYILNPLRFTGTAISSGTLMGGLADDVIRSIPANIRPKYEMAGERLRRVLNAQTDPDGIEKLLKAFRLDKAPIGRKSPLELFQIAWAAYNTTVTDNDPLNTSLISLRECIKETILELLQRRPLQDKVSSWENRLISIGRQMGSFGISVDEFEAMAEEWDPPFDMGPDKKGLDSRLSASKSATLDHDHWLHLLQRGTLFLKRLLLAVDPAKFKVT